MQTPLHGGRSAPPPAFPDCIPEEDNYLEGDLEGAGHDNPQVQGIIVAISKGGSDKYGVSNPQGAKGKINILSSPICH